MEKIKWKYDKKNKEWYTSETTSYANDGFSIIKTNYGEYKLTAGLRPVGWFRKLSSAKTVANLLRNG